MWIFFWGGGINWKRESCNTKERKGKPDPSLPKLLALNSGYKT